MTAPRTGRRPTGRRGALGSPRPARNGTDGRIRLLRVAFLVFLVLVGGRAVALASSSQHLAEKALDQQTADVVLPALRGSILDRNGVELAVGKPQQTVFATPYLLEDPRAAADELCDALQINRRRKREKIAKDLVAAVRRGDGFCYVARKVDPEYAKAAVDLGIPGVGSYEEEERAYPLKKTAIQVIGFAGLDNKGLYGIELLYDDELSGEPGSETVVRDPAGHTIRTVKQKLPVAGHDVRLTLDSEIQNYAENVLASTLRTASAKAATSVVMDPRTGEIYAMASVTRDGFHGFGKDKEADKNRAVEVTYEPGSIFKLVTISGALAEGTVKPTSRFACPYSIHVADREVHDSHAHGVENYTVRDIIRESSNVGAVKIGIDMGEERMYKWIKAFGFGKSTGIEFPVESGGIVWPLDKWSGSSIGNIPMGQGIGVTAVQMASAFSAVADNGWQVKPRLVEQVGTKVYDAVEKHRVIPGKVARQVRSMLQLAVEEGTGTAAQIPGYDVGGKTGTAQIPENGTYTTDTFVSSFIGMVPTDHPRLVVLVAVDHTPMYGGDAAAPAFQKITRFCLQHLEIAP